MLQEQIKVGNVYETKIGGEWQRVIVVNRKRGISKIGPMGREMRERDTFEVRREGEDRVLKKTRTSSQIRECEKANI